jgi:hypothetical protein
MMKTATRQNDLASALNHAVRECKREHPSYEMLRREAVAPTSKLRSRFFAKVIAPSWTSCWAWCACKQKGYGKFGVGSKPWLAHRVSYFLLIGEPPPIDLDHECNHPWCVNPFHLTPRVAGEHRTVGKLRRLVTITHCDKGHELTGDNLVKWMARRGMRGCLLCKRDDDRERATKWRTENPERYGSTRKAWWAMRGKELRRQRLAEVRAMNPAPIPVTKHSWEHDALALFEKERVDTSTIASMLRQRGVNVVEADVYNALARLRDHKRGDAA